MSKNTKKYDYKVKIKDKEKLKTILKIISWLDNIRWKNSENYNFINFFDEDSMSNSEKILTHWFCYITERQMKFEIIWDKGGCIFSELVHDYCHSKENPETLLKKYYQTLDGKSRFQSLKNKNISFASRFITVDYESILQTLEVLDKFKVDIKGKFFNRNIVAFILFFLNKYKGENDTLIRIACALHLLSYSLSNKKAQSKEILSILENEDKFENYLKKFKKNSASGKKRLWCSIRDYKKGYYKKIFEKAIKEVLPDDNNKFYNLWEKLPMSQIELPGDVWNNNSVFKEKLLGNILDLTNVPKSWELPKIVRDIYNQVENDDELKNFYPEQFDITFDFVPRMCDKKLCDICVFGEDGIKNICIPSKSKYCPVALVMCGYICKCEEDNCFVKNNIAPKMCQTVEKNKPCGKKE